MTVLNLRSVEDTRLWRQLSAGFGGSPLSGTASALASRLSELCAEAGDRMKAVPANMPKYTLHDQVHLLRVTELMSMVLGDVLPALNPIEIALLILSAHYHDHGMVLDAEEIADLEKDPRFSLWRDNWAVEHPNFAELEHQLARRELSERERGKCAAQVADLRRGMLTEYIRETHAARSRDFVRARYSADARWTALGTNLADLVGRLCESHGRPVGWMTPVQGFYDDRDVGGVTVNMRYLGLVLRLADILDLDRDRTPNELLRAIHFTNDVSVAEWEKHRSVEGWTINRDMIRFSMEFAHPAYERVARRFMDWIDEELADAHSVVRSFSAPVARRYWLDLPERVSRDRIGPKDNAYRYHDLEFTLSRDEIVKLLMTDRLYGDPSLAIRELIQNSLDALRHRRAVHARDGEAWSSGRIVVEHAVDEHGHELVRCADNGVGMDEAIVTQFLTRAGRSFYRSPLFERERLAFRAARVDFDPCARFGIGFMSCFMLGDRIIVKTRKDYGAGTGHGEPLVVEVNGLGGLLTIRRGPEDQPVGTTVEITGGRLPVFVDRWSDSVKAVAVVDGYALATEFPIVVRCLVPGIQGTTEVPTAPAERATLLELAKVKSALTFRQPFASLDQRLGGEVRMSTLVDSKGVPSLANDEAEWVPSAKENFGGPALRLAGGSASADRRGGFSAGSICVDGMLVCGTPGRQLGRSASRLGERAELASIANPHLLDIRGDLKPVLTPARVPPDSHGRQSGSWRRIQRFMWQADGRLLEQLAEHLAGGMSHEVFWELAHLNRIAPQHMRSGAIWSRIAVPVADNAGAIEWVLLSRLGELTCRGGNDSFEFVTDSGRKVVHHPGVEKWALPNHGDDPAGTVRSLVTLMGTALVERGATKLRLLPPSTPDKSPMEYWLMSFFDFKGYPISFAGELTGALAARLPLPGVNRGHPLLMQALEGNVSEEPSRLQSFAAGCVALPTHPSIVERLTGRVHGPADRWLRWLGAAFREIEWERVEPELRPPYRLWFDGIGSLEVGPSQFEAWADDAAQGNELGDEEGDDGDE